MNKLSYAPKRKNMPSLETLINVKKHGEFNGATPRALCRFKIWTAPKKLQETAILGHFWASPPTSWMSRVMEFGMVNVWVTIVLPPKNQPNRIILRCPKMALKWPKTYAMVRFRINTTLNAHRFWPNLKCRFLRRTCNTMWNFI